MAFVMLLSVTAGLNLTAYAETATSGKCGENVYWNYDETSKTLTISGKGEMDDYRFHDESPWYKYEILTIKIKYGVTKIGKHVFFGRARLTSVTIPNSVIIIESCAFEQCSSLTSVIIPNSVTTIGGSVFQECSSLTSVTIPDGVTTIEYGLFMGCSCLRSVTIPNNVMIIEENAFWCCSSLRSVTIPNSVITIGDRAFAYCSSLTNIEVASDNLNYSSKDGVLFDKNKSELIQYPIGNQRTEYTVPSSVTLIDSYAFFGCSSLTNVTISNSVKTIEDHAFLRVNSLKDVYYTGSEEEWKKISICTYNEPLTNATIHYNSTLPEQPETPDNPDSTKFKSQSFKVKNKSYEGKYGFYYTDDYFKKSATEYNQSLATMSLCLSLSTYQDEDKNIEDENIYKNVSDVFGKCGFVVDGANSTFQQKNYDIKTGTDTIACSFANKKIGDSTLVAVAIRSGGYGAEWASNLTLGAEGDHAGFDDASSKVYKYLADYVNSKNITGKVKFWITGFSRGGATANLLAAKLDNTMDSHPKVTYTKDDVYAYTFATPAGAVKSNNPHSKKYNNIFNIINFHDVVPLVAPSQTGWSFADMELQKSCRLANRL